MSPNYFDNRNRLVRAIGNPPSVAAQVNGGSGRMKPLPKLCQSCGGSTFDGPPEDGYACLACKGTGLANQRPRGVVHGDES